MSKQKEHFKSSIDFLSLCLCFFIAGIPGSIAFSFLWFITFPLRSHLKDRMARILSESFSQYLIIFVS